MKSGPSISAKKCNNQSHQESAARGLTLCVECRKPLFHRPPTKCARHSVYGCSECFTHEEFFKLRFGADDSISELEEENED